MPGRRQNRDPAKPGKAGVRIELPAALEARATRVIRKKPDHDARSLDDLVTKALDFYLEELEDDGASSAEPREELPHLKSKASPLSADDTRGARSPGLRGARVTLGSERTESAGKSVGAAGQRPRRSEPAPARESDEDLLRLDQFEDEASRLLFEERIGQLDRLQSMLDQGRLEGVTSDSCRETCELVLNSERIRPPGRPSSSLRMTAGPALASPDDRPLFGLHNRDYPSLWGLMLLIEATREGPVAWAEFASGLELAGRAFGQVLRLMDQIEKPGRGLKYSSSFPNPSRPSKGGQWIRGASGPKTARLFPFVKNTFARIQEGKWRGEPEARGPLARWGAIRFLPGERGLLLEPAAAGLELLEAADGVSPQPPHARAEATAFLKYLLEHSPGDAEGFRQVLTAARDHGERRAVVEANLTYFNRFLGRADEREAETFASTMTQGYVSRAREWGLLEPAMFNSPDDGAKVYRLTEEGDRAIALLK